MKFLVFLTIFVLNVFKCSNCQCWKKSYGRGVGTPLSSCVNGTEKSGQLCYKKCKENYLGEGPICWEQCKSDYKDYGLVCYRGEKILNKKNFLNCPPGYLNIRSLGCKLAADLYLKQSYTREAGQSLTCSPNTEQDAGLCYNKCEKNYLGSGPICWQSCNSSGNTYECGVFCMSNNKQCAQVTTGSLAAGFSFLFPFFFVPFEITNSLYTSLLTGILSGGSGGFWLANSLLFDSCPI
jgi:hypothetical protein